MSRRVNAVIALVLVALILPACKEAGQQGAGTGSATEVKSADADALLTQMSDRLKAATSFTVSTTETNERIRRNDERVTRHIDRQLSVRRPDRVYVKTTGDLDLEIYYDGKVVTLVTHKDKVFGELPAPPTLAETTDMLSERYGVPLPISDLITTDPKETLKSPNTTGGWEKRETVDGVDCNKLAYQHPNVDFALWIPVAGEPLPKKLEVTYKARRGKPTSSIVFKDWNLSAQISDETFVRKIPDDYEGIPVIQRAASVVARVEEQEKTKGAADKPAQPEKK
jgi:hypothetical protein